MSSKKTKLTISSSDEEFFQTKKRYFSTKKTVDQKDPIKITNLIKSSTNVKVNELRNNSNVEYEEVVENDSPQDQSMEEINNLSDQLLNTSLDDSSLNFKEKILLYETSPVTLDEACFAIIYFIDRFSLSEIAKKKLIELIKFLIPYKNNLPNTVYKISKIVSLSEYKPSTVNFCKNCSNETTANFNQCTNENCLEYEKVSKSFDTFKYFDIERPLKDLVKSNLPKIISYTEGSFNDILDGSHYKNISKSNYLNLMVYTDGIQISKSSKLNFWPVICGLVDLPIKIRDSIKNKIIFGVWQGKKKPTSDILFRYLKNSILKINQNGINVEQGGYKKTFYFQIYGILCDTPAKALVLNMNQFNGHYGCPYCFNPGKWSKLYHKMLYEQTDYPLRNNDDFRSDYLDGTDIEPINGLKGEIELSDMIILPNSVPIDYMHMVCLGIFKNLLKLWFDPIHKEEEFYIGKKSTKKAIKRDLKKFKFPHTLNRKNFDFESIKTWKASELRSFFLYLSLIILKSHLKPKFYWNLVCLIFALKFLLKAKDNSQILYAKRLLKVFSEWYIKYYGRANLVFNFHLLSKHLIDDVKQHGSLIGHSMFSLESSLGYFGKSLTGTRGLDGQYLRNAALHFELVSRLGEFKNSKEKTELNDFILDLYSKKHFGNIKVSLLEPTSKRKLNDFELNQFELDDFFNDVFISLRISIENTIYHSINYKRVGQETSSYCIKYKIQNLFYFGFIKYFIEIENFFYAVLCPLKTIKTCLFDDIKIRVPDDLQALKKNKIFDNFFTVCEKTENLLIINSNDVISKCIIYEENEDLFYLSDYLSEEEHD